MTEFSKAFPRLAKSDSTQSKPKKKQRQAPLGDRIAKEAGLHRFDGGALTPEQWSRMEQGDMMQRAGRAMRLANRSARDAGHRQPYDWGQANQSAGRGRRIGNDMRAQSNRNVRGISNLNQGTRKSGLFR
jgi:hypothetical protein